jgi:uncharacterized protein (DUF362 family)
MSRENGITRRELFRRAAAGAAFYGLERLSGLGFLAAPAEAASPPVLVIAANQSPAALIRAAVEKLGGMRRFVRRGDEVTLKPNSGWAMPPESAANTNPEVLVEVIRLCLAAGAKRVKVVDHPCDPALVAFKVNGLAEAARGAGAQVIPLTSAAQFEPLSIPKGKVLTSATLARDVAGADVFINLPVAKVHSATAVTLGLKNLMGVVLDRQAWHASRNLNQCIADYASAVRPKLILVDATRILLTNGPKGPGRTRDEKQVIAGTDPVAVDAYCTRFFELMPERVPHLVAAHALGLGEIDPAKMRLQHA